MKCMHRIEALDSWCPPERPQQLLFPSATCEGNRPHSAQMGMQVSQCPTPVQAHYLEITKGTSSQNKPVADSWGKSGGRGSGFSRSNQKQLGGEVSARGHTRLPLTPKSGPPLSGAQGEKRGYLA